MLLLLNTWCAVLRLFICSRTAHCDTRLTLLAGMHLFEEKARVQHAMHGPGILRNVNRDGPRLVHPTLLKPVRRAIQVKKKRSDSVPKEGTTTTKTPTARKSRRRSSDSGWGKSVARLCCPSRSSSLAFTTYRSVHWIAPVARVGSVWHGHPTSSSRTSSSRTGRSRHSRRLRATR